MAIQKTNAFVLRTTPFRSSSLIVTLFSESFGKMKGIVKGVRKEREVRGAYYELFTHLEIVFYEKTRSDLHLISEAAILDANDILRTRLDCISYASYFVELVDVLTEVYDNHIEIYELIAFAFKYLPSLEPRKISRLFEIKLLSEVGWLPHLEDCIGCGTRNFDRTLFSIAQGAVVCGQCVSKFPEARGISPESLEVLRYFSSHRFEDSMKKRMPPVAEKGIENLTEQFFQYRLNRALKSRVFLNNLKPVF